MNDRPVAVTQELIETYGFSLLEDPERLGQLLEDKCGEARHEVFVLSFALRDISRHGFLPDAKSFAADREKTVARFCENLGFSQESARWAVDSIATLLDGEGLREPAGTRSLEARRGFLQYVDKGIQKRPRSVPVRKKALRNGLLLLAIIMLFLGLFVRIAGSRFTVGDEYRLLFLSHLSGAGAGPGHVRLKAAQLAADQINASGGIKGRALYIQGHDLPDNPEKLEKVVSSLLKSARIVAVLSACKDRENMVLAKLADENKVLLVATESSLLPVTMATPNRPWLYSFRIGFDNAYKGKILAYFLAQGLGRRPAALLYDGEDPGSLEIKRSFLEHCEQFQTPVVAEVPYSVRRGIDSKKTEALLASGAGVAVLANTDGAVVGVVESLRRAGYRGAILGGEHDHLSSGAVEKAFENSWWVLPASPEDPRLLSFQASYTDRYNESPPKKNFAGVVLAYDAVRWVADALFRAPGTQGEAIRHALLSTRNLPLVHATLSIDPRTHGPWNKAAALVYCDEKGCRFQKRFWPR